VAMDFNAGFTAAAAGLTSFDHNRKTQTCSNFGTGACWPTIGGWGVARVRAFPGAQPFAAAWAGLRDSLFTASRACSTVRTNTKQ
jgi:hypothetical protein